MSFLREMRRRQYRQRVLVLTMHADADTAAEALAVGAGGFALKSDSRAALLDAIVRVMRGDRFAAARLPLETTENFLRARSGSSSAPGSLAALSVREREIFALLMRGYDNDAIGKELSISPKTVETHRTRLFRKLDVHSLGELLLFGFRRHLVFAGADPAPAASSPDRLPDPARKR